MGSGRSSGDDERDGQHPHSSAFARRRGHMAPAPDAPYLVVFGALCVAVHETGIVLVIAGVGRWHSERPG